MNLSHLLLIFEHFREYDYYNVQNWAHLMTVVEQLNHLPSKQHRTDFMRVKQWLDNSVNHDVQSNDYLIVVRVSRNNGFVQYFPNYQAFSLVIRYLEGRARFYRQTILLSYFPNPGGLSLAFLFSMFLGFNISN